MPRGRHAGQQRLLGPRRAGAPQAQRDADGPHHEHEEDHQHGGLRQHALEVARADPAGEHHEQRADEQHLQILLELDHVLEIERALVAQDDAEHRHGQQSALVLHHVRCRQAADGAGEEGRPLEELGNDVTAHRDGEEQAHGSGQDGGDQDGLAQVDRDGLEGVALSGQDDLEHQNRQHGAHRIDDDALPPQHRGDPAGGAQHAQDGPDHRRPRDDQDRPHEDGQGQLDADDPRRQGDERPGDQDRERAQPADGAAKIADPPHRKSQRSLEQDDAHGQRRTREQHVATKDVVRGGESPQAESDDQQQEDRWHPQPPGRHLAQRRDHEDHRDVDRGRRIGQHVHGHSRSGEHGAPSLGGNRAGHVAPCVTSRTSGRTSSPAGASPPRPRRSRTGSRARPSPHRRHRHPRCGRALPALRA